MAEGKGLVQSVRTYPPAVFFMLGNEFCERFSFYGMRAVLTLYLITEHRFQESQASLFYHAFVSLAFASPLIGSVVADNYFGRFRVILWVSLVYVMGHVLLSIGAIPQLDHTLRSVLDFSGLIVIALATGGIKPCVSAFAADQFGDHQAEQRTQFFSFFYFAINAGSLVAIVLTPMLRGRVKCFGSEYCFPLAFGVPGVLMLIAFLLFVAGYKYYKISPAAKGNVVFSVISCICYAAKQKVCAACRGHDKVEHWLDYAAPKYNSQLLAGVKSLVAILVLFGPLIFFWALFDQQGSTWVLQARRMDGRVGPFTILPDQMNTFNPLIILITVPIFEAFVYPAARKVCNVTPLRKMAAGGVLAAVAFIMAALLQLEVNKTMEPRPDHGEVFLQRFGNSSHQYTINGSQLDYGKTKLPAGTYTVTSEHGNSIQIDLNDSSSGYVLGLFETPTNKSAMSIFPYSCEKSENGRTRLYLLVPEGSDLKGGHLYVIDHKEKVHTETNIESGLFVDIQPALISSPEYTLRFGEGNCSQFTCTHSRQFYAQMGAAHVLHITEGTADLYTVVRPNTVNMLWQLPQFFVITLGEVLFSVTGLEFSYSQAAPNMKSVLQAVWLMTVFMGNVIDMLISGSHIVAEPAAEFFVYAVLMVLVIGVFILFSMRYTYAEDREDMQMKSVERGPPLRAVARSSI
ncbi:Peptide transporter 3 [Toxocara canis]|uniref:Peptide transporter 3 n=1 Tax=Toxocara canis TaxID=6265 RepID=A0A0B2VC63_TOXCA|nr:Peptide transporter 3 [Toxocara canis]